jgi:TonB family protein
MGKLQTTTAHFFLALLILHLSNSAMATLASTQTSSTSVANVEERQRGIALYREEKFSEAAKVLRKVLKKSKSDDEAWYYLGLSLLNQPKELKEASKALEMSLKLRPNSAAAHVGLSYSLLLRNKHSDAIREARAALTLDPNIPDAHYIIGVASLRTGDQQEALTEAEAAIKLNPQSANAYLLKSNALVSYFGDVLFLKESESSKESESNEARKARFAQAADALEKFLQLKPNAADKTTWTEQLEALQFYAASHPRDGFFSGKEVTTRARVLSKPEPAYTESARQAQVTGTVVLRVVFASDGTVKHFLVVRGLPNGLTESAISSARRIQFVPATRDGRPVSMFIQLEYNFNLY